MLGSSDSSKIEIFETYMFSIVIENSRQIHYFTEKIIDCLLTKTIPIYYGCPNISDYFDTSGWIILETRDGQNQPPIFLKMSLVRVLLKMHCKFL
jgi:hypothetical protein